MRALTNPTRTVRLLLVVAGVGVIALLVWHAGPQLVLSMLARVGWSFPAVVAIYALHIGIRATALWRCVPGGPVPYTDVLRIRLSGEAVEMLTFTGPFLAVPAKGWLLTRRGLTTADGFATVAIEYLLYTVVSTALTAIAVSLLLARGTLPAAVQPAAVLILVVMIGFLAAFVFATVTGIGLIVPMLRRSRVVIGARRADRAADEFSRVEDVIIRFLRSQRRRLATVLAIETAGHVLLMLEVWIVFAALGFSLSWNDPLVVEGGVKIVGVAFAFIPGQFGASEGAYALIAAAIGLPTAAGLTLALVRRVRSLLVAGAGVFALSWFDSR